MTCARLLLIVLLVLLAPAAARAAESAPVSSPRVIATIVSDTDAVSAGTPFRVALRLRMSPGWHTYWKNPGDAGVPPQLEFSLPPGATASEIAWPAPDRQPEGPVMTYGYSGEVVLPVTISGVGAGGADIGVHATWLVCENICVPEEGAFSLHLTAGPPAPSGQSALFAAADARVPRPSPWRATIAPDGTLAVSGPEITRKTVKQAWFVPDTWGTIDGTAPQRLSLRDGGFSLDLHPGAAFKPTNALGGVLAVRDTTDQLSSFAITATPGPATSAAEAAVPLAQALWFALLGGLILNLMPCVFPVLAIKALGLARLSNAERGHAWAHATSYAGGVLIAFAALGASLLALREAGGAAGWGFQFQSPTFVAAMAWLLFAVGLNFSGVFAIGSGPAGIGAGLAARGGHVGSFFTGLLAVLVATPCTAPFMAVAIGAALVASPVETMAVFLVMGAGLALPYVLLATLPGLTRRLPRPGRWMEILRQALAFPMYAAAAWLVWVVSAEAGPPGVLIATSGLVVLGFGAWALRLAQQARGGRFAYAAAGAAALALSGLLVGVALPAAPAPITTAAGEPGTEAFSAARLAALRSEGRPVFVNMTAAWCVTCLVNERVALAPDSVRRAFADRKVAYLKGDWTRQDPEITAFLHEHGRDGVPLYVYFPADAAPPTVLSQILTPGAVLAAIGAQPAG